MSDNYNFFAMVNRMKYIDRWALMPNTQKENIAEHSHSVAVIAHALALIGKREFGKDYDTYFSILSAIASGKTRRSEIESIIERPIGGYISRLEDDYGIIVKEMPVGAKPLSKNVTYNIRDNFFRFWFSN